MEKHIFVFTYQLGQGEWRAMEWGLYWPANQIHFESIRLEKIPKDPEINSQLFPST